MSWLQIDTDGDIDLVFAASDGAGYFRNLVCHPGEVTRVLGFVYQHHVRCVVVDVVLEVVVVIAIAVAVLF